MPACDVVEPKAPCTPAKFLWQTLFVRVDEKILSICSFICHRKFVVWICWKFSFRPFVSTCFGPFVLANQASNNSWVGHSLFHWLKHIVSTYSRTFVSRKFVHRCQIFSQQFSVKTICKPELRAMLSFTGKQRTQSFHLLGDNLGSRSVGCLIECNQSNALSLSLITTSWYLVT